MVLCFYETVIGYGPLIRIVLYTTVINLTEAKISVCRVPLHSFNFNVITEKFINLFWFKYGSIALISSKMQHLTL